jgi:hypothetical protein
MPPPPRLVPDRPLPPYTYVPGRSPHPIRDPRGHMHGVAHPIATPLDPARWRDCAEYRWGIDLFNAGYYWEAHEAWESVWHAVGREGGVADFLKGLIKLTAAGVKLYEGRPAGVTRHLRRAAALLEGATREPVDATVIAGLDLSNILTAIELLELTTLPAAADIDPPAAGALGWLKPR